MKKEIQKGKYKLVYERYIDDLGFEKDLFEFWDTEKREVRPFWGPIKVSTAANSIAKVGYTYTDEELEAVLDEQIEMIE